MQAGTFETATRVGFAARGVMYLLVAYFALSAGLAEDGAEALRHLDSGWGRLLLAAMAIGFFAYGLWRLSEAALDGECHGSDAKGVAVRAGGAASGLIHLSLAFYAGKLAYGSAGGASNHTEEGAAKALSFAGGEVIIGVAAIALLLVGLFQFVNAVRASFLKHLESGASGKIWIEWAGRAGYAARGVVFTLIGVFFVKAMLSENASDAGGMGDALASLPGTVQTLVAAGLFLFGLFSLIEARYRRITNPDLSQVKRTAQIR